MEKLSIKPSQYTPEIVMDPDSGVIEIRGKSYPENTFEFYKPVLEWLGEYFQQPKETTTFHIEIIYFNSSSSKLFFDLFDLLEEHKEDTNIEIFWIYDAENENAYEAGEEFQEDFETLHIKLQVKE